MIPYLDLRNQYRVIKNEINHALQEVMQRGQFTHGPQVEQFERQFADYAGVHHALATCSGPSALFLALKSALIGPGDEVITVPTQAPASLAAIRQTGATPVLIDIDRHSYTMDVIRLLEVITPRTKAICPIHLFGQPADMDSIIEIARENNLLVISEASHAPGAVYQGCPIGSLGDMTCYSFGPEMNLGAYGQAGMVATNNPRFALKVRALRNSQEWSHDDAAVAGFTYHMDELQAAVLNVKLRYLEVWTEARRVHAALYDEFLRKSDVTTPSTMPDTRHVYHTYVICTAQRDILHAYLQDRSIETYIHLTHLQGENAQANGIAKRFPVAHWLAENHLALPMYAELSGTGIEQVCTAISQVTQDRSQAIKDRAQRAAEVCQELQTAEAMSVE